MAKGLRKIDKVWDVLFNHFDILNKVHRNGSFIITSEEINTIGNYQARLATKFDTQADLPRVFKDYDLSLLPLSRGSYKIGHFNVLDRKSTRLNSSHVAISYAVFCLKKKITQIIE